MRLSARPQGLPQAVYSRKGASPAAAMWWDQHVARTHLRSPRPEQGVLHNSSLGLSPRRRPGSSAGGGAFPEGMTDGSSTTVARLVDPMFDPRVTDHPLRMELSELYKGMRIMDADGDGQLHPTDVVRALGSFGLSVGRDQEATEAVNQVLMRNIKGNGMVDWRKFVYAFGSDRAVITIVLRKRQDKAALKERTAVLARKRAVEKASAPKGPQLRPGITANDLRAAVGLIKEKMYDKWSNLTGAFRSMDKDSSGYISRGELMEMCISLNLFNTGVVRQAVVENLIDFIDVENDVADDDDAGITDIGYKEFARAFTCEDIMAMKPLIYKRPLVTPPPTPPPANLAAEQFSSIIKSKFKPDKMAKAFAFFDKDNSGALSRAEVKRIMYSWNAPLSDAELADLFSLCDKNGDGQIDYNEFCGLVAQDADMTNTRELVKNPTLRKGVRESDLRKAQHLVKEHITNKYKKLSSAFKFIDRDRTGTITRDELKQALADLNLTQIRPDVIETLIDFIDIDPSSDIEYREFARVLSADDIMAMSPFSIGPAAAQADQGIGRHKMTDMPGMQGLSWAQLQG